MVQRSVINFVHHLNTCGQKLSQSRLLSNNQNHVHLTKKKSLYDSLPRHQQQNVPCERHPKRIKRENACLIFFSARFPYVFIQAQLNCLVLSPCPVRSCLLVPVLSPSPLLVLVLVLVVLAVSSSSSCLWLSVCPFLLVCPSTCHKTRCGTHNQVE